MCCRRHQTSQNDPHHCGPAGCHRGKRSSPNYLGAWGFGISLFGLFFTFGLLCPLGMLLSFFGLFARKRGIAVAGLILGGIGSLFVMAGVGAVALAATSVHHYQVEVPKIEQTREVLHQACIEIETYRQENEKLPEGIEGNKLVLKFEDGFGNAVRYEPEEDGDYGIRSAGSDGTFDTDDDLRVLNSQEGLEHNIPDYTTTAHNHHSHSVHRHRHCGW